MKWEQASTLTPQVRAQICESVHELTGYGPAEIKETAITDAYLKFTDSKYKPIYTQVLSCKKNNKHQYTYYLTQGLTKNAITLIHPDPSKKKVRGRDVFRFWWIIGQVRVVPVLEKLNS